MTRLCLRCPMSAASSRFLAASYSPCHPGLSHLYTVGRDTPALRDRAVTLNPGFSAAAFQTCMAFFGAPSSFHQLVPAAFWFRSRVIRAFASERSFGSLFSGGLFPCPIFSPYETAALRSQKACEYRRDLPAAEPPSKASRAAATSFAVNLLSGSTDRASNRSRRP